MWWCLILMVLTVNGGVFSQTVKTDVGTFIGFVDTAIFNGTERQVIKYVGIPYGEQTGGVKRFSKPQPRSPLREPYVANRTDLPNVCPQLVGGYIKAEVLDGRLSEDCLYLSIYAPADTLSPGSRKHAVMVWIHGGSYLVGLSDQYPGDILSAFNNVIIVVINYRLNVFGFFSTGDKHAPGNYGLWDQRLALIWIHKHIEHFGGDPEEVTIFGGSAGSASVIYQAMFPENRGLFRRVIAQSGFPSSVVESNMLPFAKFAGCNQSSSSSVLTCLRSVSWEELSNRAEDPQSHAHFAPVIDGEFIKRSPRDLFSDPESEEMKFYSSLDVIFGVNDLEGAMFMLPFYGKTAGVKDEDISWIALNITHEMQIQKPVFENVILPNLVKRYFKAGLPTIVKSAIVTKYSDWKEPNSPTKIRDMIMDLTTDIIFHVSAVKAADAHAKSVSILRSGSNTFFYEYAFFSEIFNARPEWMKSGADHTDELLALFGFSNDLYPKYHIYSYTPSTSDIGISSLFMKHWTNFAKTGNPNAEGQALQWPKYTKTTREFLRFTSESPCFTSTEKHFGEPRVSFWLDIVPALISYNTKNKTSVDRNKKIFSERFLVDSTTAEHIIISLGAVSCFLFLCLVVSVGTTIALCKRKARHGSKYKTTRTKVELL